MKTKTRPYSVKIIGANARPTIIETDGPMKAAQNLSSSWRLYEGRELEVLSKDGTRFRYRVMSHPRALETLGRVR